MNKALEPVLQAVKMKGRLHAKPNACREREFLLTLIRGGGWVSINYKGPWLTLTRVGLGHGLTAQKLGFLFTKKKRKKKKKALRLSIEKNGPGK